LAVAALLRIRAIELHERPVKVRLAFRFGVVTLTECPQAFARVLVEDAAGRSQWGASAEMMVMRCFTWPILPLCRARRRGPRSS
jgi:hypothetical protein